jgi:hypothetical protein
VIIYTRPPDSVPSMVRHTYLLWPRTIITSPRLGGLEFVLVYDDGTICRFRDSAELLEFAPHLDVVNIHKWYGALPPLP